MRPSFAALVQVEQTLGVSIVVLAQKIASGEGLNLQEIVTLCSTCMAETEMKNSVDALGNAILAEGLISVLAVCSELLEMTLGGRPHAVE